MLQWAYCQLDSAADHVSAQPADVAGKQTVQYGWLFWVLFSSNTEQLFINLLGIALTAPVVELIMSAMLAMTVAPMRPCQFLKRHVFLAPFA